MVEKEGVVNHEKISEDCPLAKQTVFLFYLNVFPPGSTHTGQVRVKQYYASLINKVQGVLLQI